MSRVANLGSIPHWLHAPAVSLLLATLALAWTPSSAEAAPAKHSAMVIDANTGAVLYNASGDASRYPASLTKMMTLYMAFDMIERGRMSYDTRIKISKHAASQPPSKLGLKPGKKIKAIHAIRLLITKSANDIAVALAEHIGGTEQNFARLMTRKARKLGMNRTVFKNASGLPNSRQTTTARDMLKLAMHLQDNFPRHYRLFKTKTFRYNGKTFRNHNTLLGRVNGVDGIKTGYTRASGFNLVTSMRRGRRHVVAVVFGGKTARRRNARMRRLLEKTVSKASTRKTRRTRPQLIARPKQVTPPRRQARTVRPPKRTAPSRVVTLAKRTQRPAPPRPTRAADTLRTPTIKIASVQRVSILPPPATETPTQQIRVQPPAATNATATTRGRQPSTLQDQLAQLLANNPPTSDTASKLGGSQITITPPPVDTPPRRRATTPNSYHIQVGAYATPAEAERQLATVASKTENLLVGYQRLTQPVDTGQRTLYRARFAGFEATTANTTCNQLRQRSIDCIVAR